MRSRLFGLMVALLAFSLMTPAWSNDGYTLQFRDGGEPEELKLSTGKSQIIHSRAPLDQVVIGNPEIADIRLLSSRHVLILGIKPGHTNLVFRDQNRNLVALMDVVVGYDLDQLKRKLHEMLPQENRLEVRGSNDKVILSGQASSMAAMERALSVAHSYVPEGSVVNMIEVGGGNQVTLEVRVAEISRTSLKELGVNVFIRDNTSRGVLEAVTQNDPNNLPFLDAIYTDPSARFFGFNGVAMRLQALERKGLARVLAEPNLTALSGQEATFLAGGEVPIPVARSASGDTDTTTITVEFKEFGVGLSFVPTVLSDNHINIKFNAEVSAIDRSNGFQASGFNIPGFVTRRTGTTVEMGDGQAFAIAGLLENNMNNVINQVPLLGSIPVLGALFRSSEYRRDETELVVIVTPRLANPTLPDRLAAPTDVVIAPGDIDQYLLGFLSHQPDRARKAQAHKRHGGLEGRFGHQIREEGDAHE